MRAVNPKHPHAAWARRYQVALRTFLKPGFGAGRELALSVGRQAAAQHLETMDVARIHEQALLTLVTPGGAPAGNNRLIARANLFFEDTLGPIEKTHRAAQTSNARVHQLARTLRQRTADSSVSTRNLKRGVARRQAAESALIKSGHHRARLLKASRLLQKQLRRQTHQMLTDMEQEWRVTSRQLQDEIAQTLLAIHVRLLSLKNMAKLNTSSLKKEIVGTQRLVKHSVQAVRKLAHELGVAHKA